MNRDSATALDPQRLSVATTEDDVFPDFSDPNLFSGSGSSSTDATNGARNETDSSSAPAPARNKFLLPIPTASANKSQSSFALSEVGDEEGGLQSLPPEIANADISISADGSFVETTSGPAARELKRRYDQLLGVNKEVRSPYLITSLTNQHGKHVYRVGLRALVQEPTSTPELDGELHVPASGTASQAQRKRRSRISINGFMAPSVFKHTAPSPPRVLDESKAITTSTASSSSGFGPRKLRKPRSIPDLTSSASGYFGDATSNSQNVYTGRAHSQSVTAADMPRPNVQATSAVIEEPPRSTGDIFSNVMGWMTLPSSPLTSSGMTPSSHSVLTPTDATQSERCSVHSKEFIEHPFGRCISFDSPIRSSAVFLPPISVVREMQSFESGLTARADTQTRSPTEEPPQRPESFDSLASDSSNITSLSIDDLKPSPSPSRSSHRAIPSLQSCSYTRYPTTVFDVIQNYRGLPMLDSLSAESRQPTIKLSLSALDGAIPRDDPRFVIWGDVDSADNASIDKASLHDSHADAISSKSRPRSHVHSVSSKSKKRSLKSKSYGSGSPETQVPDAESETDDDVRSETAHRMLMAATIERWIAQLTSQYDYDELLIFYLTYRTYIGPLDLCHLLICRFHWALEEPQEPHEVMVKQIVRLRTFVAFRFWLLTFFRVDFLPNTELCLLLANWLNTLWRDPILDRYHDARGIVRKLKRVAKDCKATHSRRSKSSKSLEKKSKVMQSIDKILGDLSNGANFAASLRKVSQAQYEEDSDVDLDFNPDESSPFSDATGIQGFTSFANQFGSTTSPVNATSAEGSNPHGNSASMRLTNSTNRFLLQQPLHLTILQHARTVQPGVESSMNEMHATLPMHHSALSRVVVNTIGRLGRWKRVLSSRSAAAPLTPYGDTSAFDLELNATGDLLAVKGGVEQYLRMINPVVDSPKSPNTPIGPIPDVSVSAPVDNEKPLPSSPMETASGLEAENTEAQETSEATFELRSEEPATADDEEPRSQTPLSESHTPVRKFLTRVRSTERAASIGSHSSGSLRSLGTPLSQLNDHSIPPIAAASGAYRGSFPDVVSIDDFDYLSDDESPNEDGPAYPPGLRPTKRLPLRRDFEFVRRSVDSVSSMGIISRGSVAFSEHAESNHSSISSPRGLGALQQWQMNALVDDLSENEDDPGDAEAALRRLEGQINQQRQRAKEAKVDGWVRTIQERLLAGDFKDELPRNLSDGEEEEKSEDEYGAATQAGPSSSAVGENAGWPLPRSSEISLKSPTSVSIENVNVKDAEEATHTPRQTNYAINEQDGHTQTRHAPSSGAKPDITDVVPAEILESRIPSNSSMTSMPSSRITGPAVVGNFVVVPQAPLPVTHRSFILSFRAERIASHFAVIEREIFLGIKFEELVSDEWITAGNDSNVLDWMQFLRERRRKAELRGKGKISVLAASRARFNLLANFVVSEIALTSPHDRVYLVSKFIRIAWKAYTQNNFATLVAVISGLSNDWIKKSMKRSWSRIGIWETRVFEDLKAFCTSDDDFRYIRKAIAALVASNSLTSGGNDKAGISSTATVDATSSSSRSKSHQDGKTAAAPSCVPFIGVYLSQLYRFNQLPDLIDPSAPTEGVDTEPETGNFRAPAHPEVFSDLRPLPQSIQIEPLINVQKQRKIAGVIKSLVAGQHLANRLDVDVDKRLLSRCLRLSALDTDSLQKIFGIYSADNDTTL